MNKYDIVKQAKIFNLIIYSFMAVVGLFLLLFTGLGIRQEIVIIGALCILVGGAKMLGYFSNDLYRLAFQFDFAMGVFSLVIGLILLLRVDKIVELFPMFFGICILIDGVFKLQTALDARKFGIERWWIILVIAIAVAFAGFCLTVLPRTTTEFLVRLLGFNLCLDGVLNFWVVFKTVKILRRK